MTRDPHFQALEKMYLDAPINAFYDPRIEVSDAEAIVEIEVSESLFHSAQAVHGSVYFKMLDDAAFFAASSLEKEVFVLTTSQDPFHRVCSGRLVGWLIKINLNLLLKRSYMMLRVTKLGVEVGYS